MTATDADVGVNSQIIYSIYNITSTSAANPAMTSVSRDGADGRIQTAAPYAFRINQNTGMIYANETFDREKVQEFLIVVLLRDNAISKPLSSSALVRVKV